MVTNVPGKPLCCLINGMTPKELRDLMAYLVSGGWVNDKYSKTKPKVKFDKE